MNTDSGWISDFKKEVDEVLGLLRAAKAKPPASLDPRQARQELSSLESRVEELQRRLETVFPRLEAERAEKERLKERVEDFTRQAEVREQEAAASRREAQTQAARAAELEETLAISLRARAQLNAALEEEKIQKERMIAKAADLQSRLDAVGPSLDQKEEAVRAIQRRYEDASRMFLEATAEYRKEVQRMAGEIETLRSYEAERQARWEQQQRAMEAERERLQSSLKWAMDNAEAIRREGVEALEEARGLKKLPPKSG